MRSASVKKREAAEKNSGGNRRMQFRSLIQTVFNHETFLRAPLTEA